MFQAIGFRLSAWAQKWVPDPFVLAVLLTLISFLMAIGFTGFGFFDALGAWGGRILKGEVTAGEEGFWKFLTFSMQMCLILVTGYALASTKPVGRFIRRVSSIPKNTSQAASLTAFVAIVAACVNWGLGLIVGALLARQIGIVAKEEGRSVHYPLIAAAGYVGLMVWHGGFSGTAPLKMTQMKDVQEVLGGELAQRVGEVGLTQTLFSTLNITVFALLIIFIPLFFYLISPKTPSKIRGIEVAHITHSSEFDEPREKLTPATWFERTPILTLIISAMGFIYLWIYLSRISLWAIDINAINMFFLFLGLLLHGSLGNYVRTVNDSARGVGGIILQFPFYAGIQAILLHSGIIKSVSVWISENSSDVTLPIFTFLSAGLVNLFVPSGGGQWAVQGPVVVESALSVGAPVGTSIMALAYGDQLTNMLQPFWALPLLSLTGLKARDIIGYTLLIMILSLPLFIVPMLLIR